MFRKWTCLTSVILVVVLTSSLRAQWTGAVSSDWHNAANWTGGVPTAGENTLVDSRTPLTWPIIDGGTANTAQLGIGYTAEYQGELTVTGGATLNVNGELRIGRKSNDGSGQAIGILNVSGTTTTINVTNRIELGRHGFGTINMSGGYLHCDTELRMAYRFDGTGTVNLTGGTIELGDNPGISVYANDGVPDTALIDIAGGALILAGNQVSEVETLMGEGIIIGYGGEGTVAVTFDGLTTTVVALGGPSASKPDPADESTDVLRDAVLSWKSGAFTPAVNGHKLYLSENFTDVNDGIGGMVQDANSYTPDQLLEFGKTYYWRVDELSGPPDSTVFEGDIWQFTVEPFAYPITSDNIIVTASSSNSDGERPENTINGSGLDADGLHSNVSAEMWLTQFLDTNVPWIQYEFDKVYNLHQMLVWNHNSSSEPAIGYGISEATIEYSVDGVNWVTLGTTHEFAQAPGAAGYASNTTIDLSGVAAKFVKITPISNWSPFPLNQYGLSEVRLLYIPIWAREPSPGPGETDVNVDVILSFRPGRGAVTHDVYLNTDEQAVIDGNVPTDTVADESFTAPPLDLNSRYYWRIDEVNEAETPTTWQGEVWNFTTQEFFVVDDFESYNDIPVEEEGSKLVYVTWADGYENQSLNGSTIGYTELYQPSMETTIVYEGAQSVPLFYNNTVAPYSEITANVADLQAGTDWAKHAVKALTLRFYGDPNNSVADQFYVKINDFKITYDGDAANLTHTGWQMWYVDLTASGVNLGDVTTLSIGFERMGGLGGQGVVFLDSIRLYAHDRQVITPTDPGTAGLQAHYEFEGNTNDSSGNARHGTPMGNPSFAPGKVGQAIQLFAADYVVITGYKGILGANPFSISAWIKTSLPEQQQIVIYGTDVGGQRCELRVDDSGDVRIGNGSGQVQSQSVVADGTWHHVVVTISENATNSSSDVRVYIDGRDDTREATDPDAFDIVADLDVAIGYRTSRNDRGFLGQIDDVRIYDRVLSPEEAAWLSGRTMAFDKPF